MATPIILSYQKAEHWFFFRYEVGEELIVLQALIDLANNVDLPFDWYDASVISHRIGASINKGLGKS